MKETRNVTLTVNAGDYRKFEILEKIALAQNDHLIGVMYHFLKGFYNDNDFRPRTEEERQQRADWMGMTVQDIPY